LAVPRFTLEHSLHHQKMLAARLLRAANRVEDAIALAADAHAIACADYERGQASLLQGSLYVVPSNVDDYHQAERCYRQALNELRAGPSSDARDDALAETLLGLANLARRTKNYPAALAWLKESTAVVDTSNLPAKRRRSLEAVWLRLMGLVQGLSGAGDHRDTESARVALQRASELSEEINDIAGQAEALNSLGLVLDHLARQKADRQKAVAKLERALELNLRIGDYRKCFQNCRNLGLAHCALAKDYLAGGDVELAEKSFEAARQDQLQAKRYLTERLRQPLSGEVVETNFRLGEVLLEEANLLKRRATLALEEALAFHVQQADWHNEARTRHLLLRAAPTGEQRRKQIDATAEIYRVTATTVDRLESMRQYPVRLQNAREILGDIGTAAVEMGQEELAATLKQLLRKLEHAMAE
jgi:tetratricopeptide (TPR) repeat protein